jgi:Laminin G domain
MKPERMARGLLAAVLLLAACGRIETEVGAEVPPEAGPPPATAFDAGVDSGNAGGCRGDLSNIGTADFHVSLSVTTTQSGLLAVANQRSQCNPSVFWDIRIDGGFVVVEADDVASYGVIQSPGPRVDDGRPHEVLFQRRSHVLFVYVDDAGGMPTTPSTASFGQLPPVAVKTDVCIPQDGTVALTGTVTDLCIASP